MVIGIIGILKSGGAYLPLDPAYPKDRVAFMLEDSRVAVVVTQESMAADLEGIAVTRVLLDEPLPGADTNPASVTTADHLAYVIYTSGSTGKPKGALITHYNVTRLFEATDPWFRFDHAGCLDAVPLLRVRFLGVGALGSAALRRPGRDRALLGQPLPRGVSGAAGARARHRAQSDPLGVPPADPGRIIRAQGRARPALRHLRRRGAGAAESAALVRALRRCAAAAREHVRHHRDHGARHLPPDPPGRSGIRAGQRHRRAAFPICRSISSIRTASPCPSAWPGRSTSAGQALPAATSTAPSSPPQRFIPDPVPQHPGGQALPHRRSGALVSRTATSSTSAASIIRSRFAAFASSWARSKSASRGTRRSVRSWCSRARTLRGTSAWSPTSSPRTRLPIWWASCARSSARACPSTWCRPHFVSARCPAAHT